MTLSTDQISNIHSALLSAIHAAIEETLENELYTLDKTIEPSDVSYDALSAFQGDIEELADNVLETVTDAFDDELAKKTQLAIREFEEVALPHIKAQYEQDGIVDGPARREAWCNWIDSMNKNGVLSDVMAANIDADVEGL